MLYNNGNEFTKWFSDRGDDNHILNHNLNDSSVVIELGGYTGVFSDRITQKYNSNMYILEPVKYYYDLMVNKFRYNKKVHLLNCGVSDKEEEKLIYIDGDGSSTTQKNGESVKCKFITMDKILKTYNLDHVDLIQINIEGDEYCLLEYILDNDLVKYFKNIQVQFHFIEESTINRRFIIQERLKTKGFSLKYNYPFVWECWTYNNI
jgi:FkbM family methyltransferase